MALSLPEVALAGRSNVGKSTLLNQLVGQRGVARVSKTPGRTQQINFFVVDERLALVDLPGYGFARVPEPVRAAWQRLIEAYLTRRRTLRLVVVIVDLRRGIEADDRLLLDYLRAHGIAAAVVATKADKLRFAERRRQIDALRAQLDPAAELVTCSGRTGEGIEDVRHLLQRYVSADRRCETRS